VVELIGAVVATASDTDLAVESFGQGVRDIAQRALGERARERWWRLSTRTSTRTTTVSAPASGEGDDERRLELELIAREAHGRRAAHVKLSLEATGFYLPPELSEAAVRGSSSRVVGYEGLSVRAQIFYWAVGSRRVQSEFAVNGLTLYDAEPARRSRSTPRRSAARWSSLTLRSTRRAPRSCRRRWRATAPTACACSLTARRSRRAAASR
jgi:hypothetical protein